MRNDGSEATGGRTGTVIEAAAGKVRVEMDSAAECKACGGCTGGRDDLELDEKNAAGFVPGDRVRVCMTGRQLMSVYLLIYILPLLFFLAGLAVVYSLTASPARALAGGLLSTAGVYLAMGRFIRAKRAGGDWVRLEKI